MNEETKRNLIWAIAITLMVLGFFAFLSISTIPAKWTFGIQMDNNTKEAIQSINYTQIYQDKFNGEGCAYPASCFSSFSEYIEQAKGKNCEYTIWCSFESKEVKK